MFTKKKRSDENRKNYFKRWNYCVLLLRRTKRKRYSGSDKKSITDNKFWTSVKLFLSDKTPFNAKITLVEGREIIISDNETADVLNIFFSNIVSYLNLPEYPISDP